MFDFPRIPSEELRSVIRAEAEDFMGRCHFGSQGVVKTEDDIVEACRRLVNSGFRSIAFDTEINYVDIAKEILNGLSPIHVAVSYPMGRMTLRHKVRDLERASRMGVTDTCVCVDWQAVFSHRWDDLEREAKAIMDATSGMFDYNAFVIPATLMSDTEIIGACRAFDAAGVVSVKVNPGTKLCVSFEEVELIRRAFPDRFDIHPSGGIRTLADVERYLDMGCKVIHSVASLDITEEYIEKRLAFHGVEVNE